MVVGGRFDRPADVGWVDGAVVVGHRPELHARVPAARAVLVDHHVLPAAGDHARTRRGQQPESELISHRPRRHEQGRLLPDPLGEGVLQSVDRRVLAVDVVADLRLGHRPAHLRCRTGDRVGAEVDEAGRHHGLSGTAAGSPAGRTSHAQSDRFQSGTGVFSAGRGTNFDRSTSV